MTGPVRTCVGCGRKAPQGELARFVARGGRLATRSDGQRSRPGRLHVLLRACFERAAARRGFARTLREPIEIPPGLQAVRREEAPIRWRMAEQAAAARAAAGHPGANESAGSSSTRRVRARATSPRDTAAQPKAPREAQAPIEQTGPVKVASGATVKDLSAAFGVPASQIIKIMMGVGEMVTITQSLGDEAIELIADRARARGRDQARGRGGARDRRSTRTTRRTSCRGRPS